MIIRKFNFKPYTSNRLRNDHHGETLSNTLKNVTSYSVGGCLPCPKESIQSCLCGKVTSKRPCASPEWQCEQVITYLFYPPKLLQHAKKFMFDSPGLVDFAVMLEDSVLCLLNRQVM